MKRKWKNGAWSLFALVFWASFVAGCPKLMKALKTPTVSVTDVFFTGISTEKIELSVGVEIDNPNPLGLTLSGLDYQLELAGRLLAHGTTNANISLKASGKSAAQIPLVLNYREVEAIYNAAEGKDELPYRLFGKVKVKTPVADIPIPFETKGMLPVLRPPRFESLDVHIDSLSLAGAKLTLTFNLINPNNFSLTIKLFEYQLLLEDQEFSKGSLHDQKLPAKGPGALRIPVSFDFLSAGNWAYSLLTKGEARYTLRYQAVYLLDSREVKQKEEKKGELKFD